jgi:diguanylate cyclase (GGDEF)-like protein
MRALLVLLLSCAFLLATPNEVNIGVLAKRGDAKTLKRWQSTAEYLSDHIRGYHFNIVPLGFDELEEYVVQERIDFVLTNTVFYVYLEYRYGITRIATLVNKDRDGHELTQFGGVIFTHADNTLINHLTDLHDTTFAAVDALSFGGWIMAQHELLQHGLTQADFNLKYFHSHDAVARAVLEGTVDAGTVRSDTLERMANEGLLKLEHVKIINPYTFKDFPYLSSTPLYPEWPFAKLKHAPRELANKVLSTLLMMPEKERAAIDGLIKGWTIPLDYSRVHTVLQDLRLPPYDVQRNVTFMDFYHTHRIGILLFMSFFVLTLLAALYVLRLNRSLKHQQATILSLNTTLEEKVKKRTREVELLLQDEQEQRKTVDAILNAQNNLVILSDGNTLKQANTATLSAVGYTSLESFLQDHTCICDFFEEIDGYIYNFADKSWIDFVMDNPQIDHKAVMFDQRMRMQRVFLIKAAKFYLKSYNLYIVTLTDISDLEEMYEQMKDQAVKDELTRIYNRRKFNSVLDKEINRANHSYTAFALIMFDIDDFKEVNDTYGHEEGDRVLVDITDNVRKQIRQSDTFARWGGEEFMLLLPTASLESANLLAEKLRSTIESQERDPVGRVTCSFGVVEYRLGETKQSLLKRVDEQLYHSKASGKNIVSSNHND